MMTTNLIIIKQTSINTNTLAPVKINSKDLNRLLDSLYLRKTTNYSEVKNFFHDLENNIEELTNAKELLQFYENEVRKAQELGQTSYVEILSQQKELIKLESIMIDFGLTKYVTEKQVIDFYQKINPDQKLKFTWIKNYIRPIPNNVLEIKKKIDEYQIFDNYVILHYDPDHKNTALTKKEKEIAKDPILFGLIRDSRKLYFIVDWKDEYCDLTLDKMFEVLKEKVSEINNDSVKSYIRSINPNFHTFDQFKE